MMLSDKIIKIAGKISAIINKGDEVKIDMNIVKKHDNSPAYLKLLNKVIKKSKGKPVVINIDNKFAEIAADKYDALLGTVRVPIKALNKI